MSKPLLDSNPSYEELAQKYGIAGRSILDEIPSILQCPRLPGFFIQPNVRRRLAGFFRTTTGAVPSINGSSRFRNGASDGDKRDASFTKYEYDEDKNLRNNKEVEMIKVFGYGRLDFILAPAAPEFGVDKPHFLILAHINEAKDTRRDASIKRISYTRLGRLFVLDITSVKHVVGGVETRGEKAAGEWVIIDGSESLCPTVFHQEQEGFGDDD
ncbi:hypothetical protein RhiJN_18475 [Ceratobasidium sp. AG-Ba]|nr:hypothetical protein RhiJN_18475 [Ceratobasidium sp. AG-Ba]